ncbi:MAG: FAD-dependent oxidoreductase [Verrucomicrobiae bacterium]|nr:FAD-dependent oxidoreductase [Verrucomicrobiae bacterium]NNJ87189.1 FAD-dependent oxidoreductase [Akkermansiaceae bacterium]
MQHLIKTAICFFACLTLAAAATHEADVVVYCDTSGGVTAAVQAAKMGKKTILVSPYGHPGGMTISGLGWTDLGNVAILGGLSREFYHQLYQHYQKDAAWTFEQRDKFRNKGQGAPALDPRTELASTFEPKVAEQVFRKMLSEHPIKIIIGRLDLSRKAQMDGTRIRAIHLEGGDTIKGKMFIDASYEGDLLEAAGVSFTVGRESNATYDEHGNGITGALRQNQLRKGIDPYVIKGKPESGLLPGVNPDMGGEVGDGDHRLQAYCYRMVLTRVPENCVPIKKPANYRDLDYEILFRAIEQGKKWGFFKTSPMPNHKTDSNNTGGISTDYIGMNYGKDWSWATLNHEQREKLAAKHRDWQLGLVWTLQNHPRVPEAIRKAHAGWGLAKDEFTDNGHWPYNLYIREARRMVSELVMTEHHCRRKKAVNDPVGLGAYTMDSHNTQRFVKDGMVRNEGDIQEHLRGKPYGISFRAIVPKASECENLLVPWALSASHIAFGSIRMEPVFMILGQSAATAASLSIDRNCSLQDLPYEVLAQQLVKDGQVLTAP